MGGQDGRHWEGVLIPRNVVLVTAYEKGWPRSLEIGRLYAFGADRQSYAQLSINHWKLGICAELARAAAWDATAYERAAEVVDGWLKAESQAWWLNEQCVGGGHSGMHVQAELIAFAGALKRGDSALVSRLMAQLGKVFAVCSAVASPNGLICCVGERQESGPELPQLSAYYRVVTGMPHRGPLRRNPEQIDTDTYWLCVRMARAMGTVLRFTPFSLPKMRRRLTVERSKDMCVTTMAPFKKTGAEQEWAVCHFALAERNEGKKSEGVRRGTAQAPSVEGAVTVRSAT